METPICHSVWERNGKLYHDQINCRAAILRNRVLRGRNLKREKTRRDLFTWSYRAARGY